MAAVTGCMHCNRPCVGTHSAVPQREVQLVHAAACVCHAPCTAGGVVQGEPVSTAWAVVVAWGQALLCQSCAHHVGGLRASFQIRGVVSTLHCASIS